MNISDNAFVPTMDAPITDHFEDTDTIADSENVEFRKTGGHGKTKDAAPEWVLKEFQWKSRVDQITGETQWFMSPIPTAVELTARSAPDVLADGIENMTDEDTELARQLAADIRSLIETATVVDGYLEKAIPKFFAGHLAKNCIFLSRRVDRANSWTDRLKKDEPEPDALTDMVGQILSSTATAAVMRYALLDVAPNEPLNFKSAAWDVYKWQAWTHQNAYLNPDELGNREENTKDATKTLMGRLRNRHISAA